MAKISLLVGAAAGYVLGARAGRERYDQIEQKAAALLDDPRVQKLTRRASEAADQAADTATEKADQGLQKASTSSDTGTSTSTPTPSTGATPSTTTTSSRPGATVADITTDTTGGSTRG